MLTFDKQYKTIISPDGGGEGYRDWEKNCLYEKKFWNKLVHLEKLSVETTCVMQLWTSYLKNNLADFDDV